jgi:hypothetical protein
MNAIAKKLKEAGIDTIGARLTTICTEAIRRHPDSVVDAWRYVGAMFGHEFVRGIMQDMGAKEREQMSPLRDNQAQQQVGVTAPYKPRVIPKERLEKRRELQQIVRSKYRNSNGIAWSEVGWNELVANVRDGNEAQALLAAAPANVPNDGRKVGDVLGIKRIDEIIEAVRKAGS